MPNVFIVIGDGGTRKSALVRALTGASNRRIYDIEDSSSNKQQFFVQVRSLQEANISPQNFILEMQSKNVSNILTTLRINGVNGQQSGVDYIAAFRNAGWLIDGIAIMSAATINGLPTNYTPITIPFINSTARAANEMASNIRQTWGWK